MGVKGYFREFAEAYKKTPPKQDPAIFQRAMQYREHEKTRVAALANEYGELKLANERMSQQLAKQQTWMQDTCSKLSTLNSKLQTDVSRGARSSGGVRSGDVHAKTPNPGPEMRSEKVPPESVPDDTSRQEGPHDVRERDTRGDDSEVRPPGLHAQLEDVPGAGGGVSRQRKPNRRVVIQEPGPDEDTPSGVRPPPEPLGDEREQ